MSPVCIRFGRPFHLAFHRNARSRVRRRLQNRLRIVRTFDWQRFSTDAGRLGFDSASDRARIIQTFQSKCCPQSQQIVRSTFIAVQHIADATCRIVAGFRGKQERRRRCQRLAARIRAPPNFLAAVAAVTRWRRARPTLGRRRWSSSNKSSISWNEIRPLRSDDRHF